MKIFHKLKIFFLFVSITLFISGAVLSFSSSAQTKTILRVGERLTYNISFAKFDNAAYAEIYVVSNGKLSDKSAYELSAKLKSSGLVSAAFYLLDETRSTFIAADTGLPLYVRHTTRTSGLPKETIFNFINSPTTNFDLLSLIYKVRETGGAGTFAVQENGKNYNFDFTATGGEVFKAIGTDFETTISTVQSAYLTDLGITEFRINFTNDDRKIPVQIRFKTAKGNFNARIASIQNLEPALDPELTPTPIPVVTPVRTPTPEPTPPPYIENLPLTDELAFELGEVLIYQVSNQGNQVATITLQARERNLFRNEDSLLLTAKVTGIEQGKSPFLLNDGIEGRVDPLTLTPTNIDLKFSGLFSSYNQSTVFDSEKGFALVGGGTKQIEIPVGTHSIMSLAYAVRSFNLKPSLDPTNPVNDTRVAVLFGDDTYVLTLRPQTAEIINLKGEKVGAQLITIKTGNPTADALNIRLWLGNDSKRLPLRLMIGNYQADLIDFNPPPLK